jgi:hypothetical protein
MSEDQNVNEQGANKDEAQQTAAVESGSVALIANVDVPYAKGEQDEDGNEVYGYARGGESFSTSQEQAEELVSANKAYFAKENENGNLVVDEEKTSEFKNQGAKDADDAAHEASVEFTESQPARFLNTAQGMLGRDAAESNSMPGDADELTGRWTDAGGFNREQELHANEGVSRPV